MYAIKTQKKLSLGNDKYKILDVPMTQTYTIHFEGRAGSAANRIKHGLPQLIKTSFKQKQVPHCSSNVW